MVRSARTIVRTAITGAERDRVLAALEAGTEPKAIAATEGCEVGRIYFIRGRYGQKKAKPVDMVDPAPAPTVPQDLTSTGGKYARLRAYADARGLTFMQAQADWHRVQRGVPPIERGI